METLLKDVQEELGWMYETLHTDGKTKGRINFTVWSENFACPECGKEFIFHHEARHAPEGTQPARFFPKLLVLNDRGGGFDFDRAPILARGAG